MAAALWTKARRDAVEAFVRVAAQRMRLADWNISVNFDDEAGDDESAHVVHPPMSRHVEIRFHSARFLGLGAPAQRQTLCHELAHCLSFDLAETASRMFAAIDAAEMRDLAEAEVAARVEWVTDAVADLATALVADLPVPADVAPLRAREFPAA